MTCTAQSTAAALSPSPGPKPSALDPGLVRQVAREHRPRARAAARGAGFAEAPDQVAGGVDAALPGAPSETTQQPCDAFALVERRRRHARKRKQVVKGIVRGAHAARTLSGRSGSPDWPC